MNPVLARIDDWERIGLIDAALASRLRVAEADGSNDDASRVSPADTPRPDVSPASPTSLGSFFGPTVAIGEMFGYLGVGFLLGAWVNFLVRIAGTTDRDAILGFGTAGAALAMTVLGGFLARRGARGRRGAGVAFVTATTLFAGATEFGVQFAAIQGPASGLVVSGVAVAAALGFRMVLPAVVTQIGLLGAATGLTVSVLEWLNSFVVAPLGSIPCCANPPEPATPVVVVVIGAVVWLGAALVLGLLGLLEARRAQTEPAAARRAALTRLWAGLVAIGGLATSVTQSGSLGNDEYGRLVTPWIGEVAILVLVGVLVERAIRRESAAFVIAAAIGLIVALTDFNFSYLTQSTDVGLLVEGAILLGVGFGADRLRRRLVDRRSGEGGSATQEADASASPEAGIA